MILSHIRTELRKNFLIFSRYKRYKYNNGSESSITNHFRCYSDDKSDDKKPSYKLEGIANRYKIFEDYDSPVILDVDEERQLRREKPELLQEVKRSVDILMGYNLERGKTGVFDVEELVDVLRRESCKDIVTIKIAKDIQYAEYMIIITGKSVRHLSALCEFLFKLFKKKRSRKDPLPNYEGDNCDDWKVIDFGNIVLHMFLKEARELYDIELLWSVGKEYDDLSYQKDDVYTELLQKHSHPSLAGIKPIST